MRLEIAMALIGFAVAEPAAGASWLRTLEGRGDDQLSDLAAAPDGSLVVAGTTGGSAEKAHAWLLRLDHDGAVTDEAAYVATAAAFGGGPDGIAVTADGGAIITGRNVLDIFTIHHAWVARLDPSWQVAWVTRFFTAPDGAGLGRYFLLDAVATADGGVAAAGSTAVTDGAPAAAWIVKLDAAGTVEWQHEYSGGPADIAAILADPDGGLVVAGTSTPGAGLGDAWAMKVDALGAVEWQRRIGDTDQDAATAIVAVAASGYALAGWTNSVTSSRHAAWVIRLDDAGAVLWHRVLGDAEWSDLRGIATTAEGGLVVTGRIGEPGWPSNDLWLVKLRASDGEVLWQRAWAGDSGDWGAASIELASGELATIGTWAWGFAEEAAWVMRTAADGTIAGCALLRETAVTTSEPPMQTAAGAVTVTPPAATTGAESLVAAPGLSGEVTHCFVAGCVNQGNVLLAVKQMAAVELLFTTAPASDWRVYRDQDKLDIGRTALPPDVAVASFVDAAAVPAAADYYYYLRGLCAGVPGP